MPQINSSIAATARPISKRALSSLANHRNSYQGASMTFAAGASTIGRFGGNGLGAAQKTWNSEIEYELSPSGSPIRM